MITKRDEYFDLVRGMAITAVVGIHATATGLHLFQMDMTNVNFLISFCLRQALICAVPLFFFLSGYFVFPSNVNLADAHNLVRKRLTRVLCPYLIWSTMISVIFKKDESFNSFLIELATGGVAGPYYYVFVLSFFYILTPFFARHAHRPKFLFLCLLASAIDIAVSYFVYLRMPETQWQQFYMVPSAWVGFYGFGLFLRQAGLHKLPTILQGRAVWIALVVSLAISATEGAWWNYGADMLIAAEGPVRVGAHLYSYAAIITMLYLHRPVSEGGYLAELGRMSYGIFLLHEPLRAALTMILFRYSMIADYVALYYVLIVPLTLVICVMFLINCKRLLGKHSVYLTGY